MQLVIDTKGTVRALYTEAIDLGEIGKPAIVRASHVEPAPGGWTADMSPVGGPILGPYPKRSHALAAEVAWLEANAL